LLHLYLRNFSNASKSDFYAISKVSPPGSFHNSRLRRIYLNPENFYHSTTHSNIRFSTTTHYFQPYSTLRLFLRVATNTSANTFLHTYTSKAVSAFKKFPTGSILGQLTTKPLPTYPPTFGLTRPTRHPLSTFQHPLSPRVFSKCPDLLGIGYLSVSSML